MDVTRASEGTVDRVRTALEHDPRRWQATDTRVVLLLLLTCSVLYLATAATGPAQVNDTRAASVASWSLGTRGTPVLPQAWPDSRNYWGAQGRDGRVLVNRFPGVAYWAAPAYALADLVDDGDPPAHPFLIDPAPARATAALTAAAATAVLFALLREVVSRRAALAATAVVATGTSLWSVAADALWPHAPALLTLGGMLLAWRRGRPVAVAGGAAVAVLVRPHLVVAVVVLAGWAWWQGRRGVGDRAGDAAAFALGGGLGLALLSGYTWWAFGSPLPVAGYDVAGHLGGLASNGPWSTVRDLGLALGSPSHGLLVWSPVVVPALVALAVAWRRVPAWTLASAAAGLAYLVVQVRAVGYRGGVDFVAYRTSLEPLLLASPALVAACVEVVRRRRWVLAVLGVSAAVSIGLHAHGAVTGGIAPDTVQRWEDIDAAVRDGFGDRRLGEVDLRR